MRAAPDGRQQWRAEASPRELRRFLDDVRTVEPLLRRVAGHQIETTMPLDRVVTTVLRVAGV